MPLTLYSMRCPSCNAALEFEEGRTRAFCSYCGTPIILNNENEYIYHEIDEAGIKRAETERIVKLRELDLEEKQAEREEKRAKRYSKLKKILLAIWIPLTIIIVAIGIIAFLSNGVSGLLFTEFIGAPIVVGGATLIFRILPEREDSIRAAKIGGIRLPRNIFPYTERSYEEIASLVQQVGFTNVVCISDHDAGLFEKVGNVTSITVNGSKIYLSGGVYLPSAPIVITYHGR